MSELIDKMYKDGRDFNGNSNMIKPSMPILMELDERFESKLNELEDVCINILGKVSSIRNFKYDPITNQQEKNPENKTSFVDSMGYNLDRLQALNFKFKSCLENLNDLT